MFRDIEQVEEFVEEDLDRLFEDQRYIDLVFEIAEVYGKSRQEVFEIGSLEFDKELKKLNEWTDYATERIKEFGKFIADWQDKLVDRVKEYYEEDNQGYDSFEDLLDSKDSEELLHLANEDLRMEFEDNDFFAKIEEFIMDKKINLDERNSHHVTKDINENIYEELSEIENRCEELPMEILEEAFEE